MIEKLKVRVQKVLPLVYEDSLSYYEVLDKVVVYLNDTIDSVNECERIVNTFESRMNTAESNIVSINGDIDNLEEDISTINTNITNLQSSVTSLSGQISAVATRVGTAEGNITSLQNDIAAINRSINALTDSLSSLATRVTALEGKTTVNNVNDSFTVTYNGTDSGNVFTPEKKIYKVGRNISGEIFVPSYNTLSHDYVQVTCVNNDDAPDGGYTIFFGLNGTNEQMAQYGGGTSSRVRFDYDPSHPLVIHFNYISAN